MEVELLCSQLFRLGIEMCVCGVLLVGARVVPGVLEVCGYWIDGFEYVVEMLVARPSSMKSLV